MAKMRGAGLVVVACGAIGLLGCSGISIEPSCPTELREGESQPVRANEINPGAIATYTWEVFPADAGTFADPNAASTTFEAAIPGEAILRLTASDGLYQVISECRTLILVSGVAVALAAEPSEAAVGTTVTLTCSSVGDVDPSSLTVLQVDGQLVDLTDVSDGVVSFVPADTGTRTFRCIGEDAAGAESDPVFAIVLVDEDAGGADNENTNDAPPVDNTNANDAAPPNENENAAPSNENTNDNSDAGNTNDNSDAENDNDNSGRPATSPPRPR